MDERTEKKVAHAFAATITVINGVILLYFLCFIVGIGFSIFDPHADIYVWPAALVGAGIEIVSIVVTESFFRYARKFVSGRLVLWGRILPLVGLGLCFLYFCLDFYRLR